MIERWLGFKGDKGSEGDLRDLRDKETHRVSDRTRHLAKLVRLVM